MSKPFHSPHTNSILQNEPTAPLHSFRSHHHHLSLFWSSPSSLCLQSSSIGLASSSSCYPKVIITSLFWFPDLEFQPRSHDSWVLVLLSLVLSCNRFFVHTVRVVAVFLTLTTRSNVSWDFWTFPFRSSFNIRWNTILPYFKLVEIVEYRIFGFECYVFDKMKTSY